MPHDKLCAIEYLLSFGDDGLNSLSTLSKVDGIGRPLFSGGNVQPRDKKKETPYSSWHTWSSDDREHRKDPYTGQWESREKGGAETKGNETSVHGYDLDQVREQVARKQFPHWRIASGGTTVHGRYLPHFTDLDGRKVALHSDDWAKVGYKPPKDHREMHEWHNRRLAGIAPGPRPTVSHGVTITTEEARAKQRSVLSRFRPAKVGKSSDESVLELLEFSDYVAQL